MWYIVVFIASVLVSYALAPKPPIPEPASLSDINVPMAEPGSGIPVVFGRVVIEDSNTVWYGDLNVTPIESGGK